MQPPRTPSGGQGVFPPEPPKTVFGVPIEGDAVFGHGMYVADTRIVLWHNPEERAWFPTLWAPCATCECVLLASTFTSLDYPFEEARDLVRHGLCHDCLRVQAGEIERLTAALTRQDELVNLYAQVLAPNPSTDPCHVHYFVEHRHQIRLVHKGFQMVDDTTRSGDFIAPAFLQGTDLMTAAQRCDVAQRLGIVIGAWVDVIYQNGLYGFRATDLTIHLMTDSEYIRYHADLEHLSAHQDSMVAVEARSQQHG